jgi:glycerol dehydrogenase
MRGHFLVQKYLQGPGILSNCGQFLSSLLENRGKVLLLADDLVMPLVLENFKKSVADAKSIFTTWSFGGECSEEEIAEVKDFSLKNEIKIIAGAGGGKALDTARMVCHHLKLPMISIPTIAATNAATSSLAAVYSKDHVYKYPVKIGKCPDLVIADTEIIANAPVRFLVAGMGDALSTMYEGEAMKAAGKKTVHGTDCNETALIFSKLANDTIMEKGYLAKISAERRCVSPALEDVIEAILFLSEAGAEGGGGTAVPHGLHAAFTILPEIKEIYHGERVAFGILVQLILENRPLDELLKIQRFYLKVGLPVVLKDIRIIGEIDEKIHAVVNKACEPGRYVHNMPFEVSEKSLFSAIMVADALGREFLAGAK